MSSTSRQSGTSDSYAIDYGANAKGYIDAFFQNVNWDEIQRRSEEARALSSGASD